jgi:hypothetical protein
MRIGRALSIALLSGAAFAASTITAQAQDVCADGLAQIDVALQTTPPLEGDAPTIQALVDDARAKQAAGDIEGCTASVAQVKQMLQIQ